MSCADLDMRDRLANRGIVIEPWTPPAPPEPRRPWVKPRRLILVAGSACPSDGTDPE